jgi:hypothetical protein
MLTYLWVIFLSSWGGLVGYLRKLKQGKGRCFSALELLIELIISSFVGIVTFYLCETQEIDSALKGAIIASSGVMGSKAIYFLDVFFIRQTKNFGLYEDKK